MNSLKPHPDLLKALNQLSDNEEESPENNNVSKSLAKNAKKRLEKQRIMKENEDLRLELESVKTELEKMKEILMKCSLLDEAGRTIILKNEIDDVTCVICHDDIPKCEKCKRRYHQDCIGKWVKSNHGCPVCKVQFTLKPPKTD